MILFIVVLGFIGLVSMLLAWRIETAVRNAALRPYRNRMERKVEKAKKRSTVLIWIWIICYIAMLATAVIVHVLSRTPIVDVFTGATPIL